MTLDPGAYTAIVSGENETTGVSLVEAYNLSSEIADSKFANISTRGNVGTGENVMTTTFQGRAPTFALGRKAWTRGRTQRTQKSPTG